MTPLTRRAVSFFDVERKATTYGQLKNRAAKRYLHVQEQMTQKMLAVAAIAEGGTPRVPQVAHGSLTRRRRLSLNNH